MMSLPSLALLVILRLPVLKIKEFAAREKLETRPNVPLSTGGLLSARLTSTSLSTGRRIFRILRGGLSSPPSPFAFWASADRSAAKYVRTNSKIQHHVYPYRVCAIGNVVVAFSIRCGRESIRDKNQSQFSPGNMRTFIPVPRVPRPQPWDFAILVRY